MPPCGALVLTGALFFHGRLRRPARHYRCPEFALRLSSWPPTIIGCPRGELGSAGRVHGRTAAFRTPAPAKHRPES